MATEREVVMFDAPEAAKEVTVTGWASRHGLFFGEDERTARYDGCTHRACEQCGTATPKHRLLCRECSSLKSRERWLALPEVEWTPLVCIYQDDTYFHDEDGFLEWCEDNEVDPATVMLVACEPVFATEIDAEDYFADDIPEDGELPDEIAVAVGRLNDVIRNCKTPLCWRAAAKRVAVPAPVTEAERNDEERGR